MHHHFVKLSKSINIKKIQTLGLNYIFIPIKSLEIKFFN